MKLQLKVLKAGQPTGQAIPITIPRFLIGRDPKCNLRPTSDKIGARHCALIQQGDQVYLKELDTAHPTLLNSRAVKGAVALHDSDVVMIGPLTFQVALETPPPAPDDDAAAALLLSDGAEEASAPALGDTLEEMLMPADVTAMDLPTVPEAPKTPAQPAAPAPEQKAEAKKPALGAAQVAANDILKRYLKGQRDHRHAAPE